MAEKCASSNSQPVGCQRIQKMDAAIRKLQKNHSSFGGWIIIGLCLPALLIGGLFVYRTFWPISYPTEIRLDVRVDGGGTVSEETKANVKLELSEALLAMEERAAAAYNEKFATLLTILTIFGIAWPVIIALLQFKFSEKELKKIENAQEKAEESQSQSSVAREKAEGSLKQANEAREKAEDSLKQASEAREKAEDSLKQASEAKDNAADSLKQASEAREKAEDSLKQASEAREKAQECLDDIAETNMRIYRCSGEVYYHLASTEAAKYSDLAKIDNSKKVDLLYKYSLSIDSYIRATLAVKDDNACRRTVYTKINNMCDWIEKIIPDLKSQFLMSEFSFCTSFFGDIPDNGNEKVKIMERLGKIASYLTEDCPEPEIFDPDGKH